MSATGSSGREFGVKLETGGDQPGGEAKPKPPAENNKTPPPTLADVEARLKAFRMREPTVRGAWDETDEDKGSTKSLVGVAYNIGIELVVALAVACGLGLALDDVAGTKPWGMVVMFFLGVGAGASNAFRAIRAMGYGPFLKPEDAADDGASAAPPAGRRGSDANRQ